jgi:hypothetical protein
MMAKAPTGVTNKNGMTSSSNIKTSGSKRIYKGISEKIIFFFVGFRKNIFYFTSMRPNNIPTFSRMLECSEEIKQGSAVGGEFMSDVSAFIIFSHKSRLRQAPRVLRNGFHVAIQIFGNIFERDSFVGGNKKKNFDPPMICHALEVPFHLLGRFVSFFGFSFVCKHKISFVTFTNILYYNIPTFSRMLECLFLYVMSVRLYFLGRFIPCQDFREKRFTQAQ